MIGFGKGSTNSATVSLRARVRPSKPPAIRHGDTSLRTALARGIMAIGPRLRPYVIAEVLALVTASLGLAIADHLTLNVGTAVFTTLLSGFIGYYCVLLLHMIASDIRPRGFRTLRWAKVLGCGRRLALEMGGAEALDVILISPLLFYLCYQWLPDKYVAILLSETLGTGVFYAAVFAFRHLSRTGSD